MNRYTVRLTVECEVEALSAADAASKCQSVDIRNNMAYGGSPENTRIVAINAREWIKPPEETER